VRVCWQANGICASNLAFWRQRWAWPEVLDFWVGRGLGGDFSGARQQNRLSRMSTCLTLTPAAGRGYKKIHYAVADPTTRKNLRTIKQARSTLGPITNPRCAYSFIFRWLVYRPYRLCFASNPGGTAEGSAGRPDRRILRFTALSKSKANHPVGCGRPCKAAGGAGFCGARIRDFRLCRTGDGRPPRGAYLQTRPFRPGSRWYCPSRS